jgi:hypothetical protein
MKCLSANIAIVLDGEALADAMPYRFIKKSLVKMA